MHILFVIIVSLVPLLDLLHPGFPVTHDGQDHVARIANFYASLSEGHIVPRWAANLNWGYGHPVIMFLYPLPSYIASVFHAVGFSFVDSTKLVFAIAFVGSVLAMYAWGSFAWGRGAGLAMAILYGFAPYRFVDLYVRGAIGEHVAFVFPPLICLGLAKLARLEDGRPVLGFLFVAFGVMLLILSHNALSLMFLPLIGLYAVYLALSHKRLGIGYLLVAGVAIAMGFLLSAFYWMPAFFEGKYTLRDIVTRGEISERFVSWRSFLYSPWSYGGGNALSKWLGAGQMLSLFIALYRFERWRKNRRLMIALFMLLFFSLFAQTALSEPVWNTISILQKFQFPWRLMSLSVFILSVIGGVAVASELGNKRLVVVLLIAAVSVVSTIPMWRARAYVVKPEQFFTGIYDSTTDTGESSPIWSVRFMEKRPAAPALLFPGNGVIEARGRTTTERSYVVTVSEPSRFIENTLYFPGWRVMVDGVQLPEKNLIFQDPLYRGLMTFDIAPGTHRIEFRFTETKLRMVADAVSLGAITVLILSLGTMSLWRRNH